LIEVAARYYDFKKADGCSPFLFGGFRKRPSPCAEYLGTKVGGLVQPTISLSTFWIWEFSKKGPHCVVMDRLEAGANTIKLLISV